MSVLKGIALITGSAQGIGRGIAHRLARDGFDIALNDVSTKRDQLSGVADEIEKIGRRALVVPANVVVEQEVKGMVEDAAKGLGGLDVMVANAGIAKFVSLVSTELDDWERIMTINARGAFLCYKYAAQQMIKQGRGGRIIGACSSAGKRATVLGTPYGTSKFAVRGLTQAAALELGKYDITVNSYAPGFIDTPMTANLEFEHAEPELVKSLFDRVDARPVKDSGQPEDVAGLVSYLVSKEARLITGQCIVMDGGICLT